MIVVIEPSTRKNKKFVAIFPDGDRVHFGSPSHDQYYIHKNLERKMRYIKRHDNGKEDWGTSGLKTAGAFSRWILWNKPTLDASIKDMEKKFKIKIIKHF